ncbi:MAG: MFS transporter [Chloroflexota bacterium]
MTPGEEPGFDAEELRAETSLGKSIGVAATLGLGMYLGGALLPEIRADLGVDLSAGALVVSLPWGTFVVGALLAPVAAQAIGVHRTIGIAMLAAAGAIAVVAAQESLLLLLVGLTLFSALATAGHVLGASIAADAVRRGRPNAIMLVSLAFAGGAFAAPLISSLLLRTGGSWRLGYLIVLISAIAIALPSLWREREAAAVERVRGPGREAFRDPSVRRASVGLALYVGSEATLTGWLVTILRERGLSDMTSATALSLFWSGIIAGRLLFVLLGRAAASDRHIACGASLGAVGFIVLTQIDVGGAGSMTIALCTGLATAGLFPAILASGTARASAMEGAAATAVAAGGIGGIAVPWIVGTAADVVGFSLAMALAALVPILLAVTFAIPSAEMSRRWRPGCS